MGNNMPEAMDSISRRMLRTLDLRKPQFNILSVQSSKGFEFRSVISTRHLSIFFLPEN